ncbi:MAG: phospho-sugar mutase, partial [Clostridia bacterium]|nr:phospho-sugar mutase [Clostridia bacterium]
AAWYKNRGMTLVDGLNEIYAEYGYYLDHLDSFTLKGKDGAEKIQQLMVYFRNKGTDLFEGISEVMDFEKGIRDLPIENVLKYLWDDGSWMAVRPSGTEPKIKVYYSIQDKTKELSQARLAQYRKEISSVIEG